MAKITGINDAFDLRNRKSSNVVTATTNGVPTGGATGTVLIKSSATDYDDVWASLATAGIAAASHTHSVFSGLGSSVTGMSSAAGVALPISTANNTTASGAITFQTGTSSTASTTTGTLTIASGSHSSLSTGLSGAVSIKSGDTVGAGGNSGAVTIDSGTKSGTGTAGTVSIGATNASTINIGTTAATSITIGHSSSGNKTLAIQPTATNGTNTIGIGTGTVSTASMVINIGTAVISSGTSTITIGAASGSTTSLAGTVTHTGSTNLAAGTTAINPLKFTLNSSTPTLTAGVVDYDGNAFFATPKVNNTTAGKGLIPTQQIFIPNAATTISTTSVASATTSGAAMGNKFIFLAASTTYEVDAVLYVQASWTGSQATNFGVNLSYPASSTALLYAAYSTSTSSTASATGLQMGLNSTTAFTVSASPATGTFLRLNLKGIIKTAGTAGNFSPTFTLTNGATLTPTATLTIAANSFIKVNPIAATGADINIGGWA